MYNIIWGTLVNILVFSRVPQHYMRHTCRQLLSYLPSIRYRSNNYLTLRFTRYHSISKPANHPLLCFVWTAAYQVSRTMTPSWVKFPLFFDLRLLLPPRGVPKTWIIEEKLLWVVCYVLLLNGLPAADRREQHKFAEQDRPKILAFAFPQSSSSTYCATTSLRTSRTIFPETIIRWQIYKEVRVSKHVVKRCAGMRWSRSCCLTPSMPFLYEEFSLSQLFEELVDICTIHGHGLHSVTVGVLRVLRSSDFEKLKAWTELSGEG